MKTTRALAFCSFLLLTTIYSCKKNDPGFVQTSPANGASNVGATQVLACTSVSGAVSYAFTYKDGAGSYSKTSTSDTTTIQNLKPCNNYTWSVTATKADGSTVTTQPDWVFTTSANALVPCLSSPGNKGIDICLNPELSWSTVSGSAAYDVEIATDAYFNNVVYHNTVPADHYTLPVTALSPGTQYYWHVAAATGLYSATYTFTTVGSPTLSSPDNHSASNSRTPSLSWSSNTCTSDYTIDISTSNTFGSFVVSQQVTGSSFTVSSPLSAYTTYYWRVRVNSYSATSPVWSFSTGL